MFSEIKSESYIAKSLGVEYSEKVIEEVFQIFGDKFANNPFFIKTENKRHDKANCYFRYAEEHQHSQLSNEVQ